MNYEKKYKDALERAKIELNADTTQGTKNVLMTVFPELKDSEDEQIRKGLIKALGSIGKRNWGGIDVFESIAWLEKQKSVRETVERCKNSWYNEGKIAGMAEGLTNDEKYQQGWHDALENQGKADKESYDIAEKEKYDLVCGQFIQCRKSFYEFKEYNSYWFEYVGNDTYIGRSDNILNKKFHITPRQLYCLFTQQRFYPNPPTAYGKYGEQKKQVHFPKFTFDDVLALQCCMETVKKIQEDKDLYEKLNDLHGRVYDAYHLENQGEQKPTRINKIWWRILQHINKAINTIKKIKKH